MQNEYRTPDPVQGISQRVEEASPRISLPALLERSAAVSKTSRSAWEVRRRRELAACCGWSRTTQPRSVPACHSAHVVAASSQRKKVIFLRADQVGHHVPIHQGAEALAARRSLGLSQKRIRKRQAHFVERSKRI